MITIRPERAADLQAVGSINRKAFGQTEEADIVDARRSATFFSAGINP